MERGAPDSPQWLAKLLSIVTVVAVLYLARDVLIPLALAVLLSFLLSPLVTLFERLRLPRVPAAALALGCALAVVGLVGYLMASEFVRFANDLPQYKDNIRSKLQELSTSTPGPLARAAQTVTELQREFAPAAKDQGRPAQPVQVIEPPTNPLELLYDLLGPLLTPLATLGIIIILSGVLLLTREEVRNRFIRLVSAGELAATTQAIEEAAQRVSRYLLSNLAVNVLYGLPVGVGLYLIGIPNAPLWGMLCTILRFIPYLGAWLGAAMPLAVSVAVSEGWREPLLAASLFLSVELVSNNILEPWLYGASTGLSSLAVLVGAIFWTWLWGAVGLFLATPLTVCCAVLGRYVPQFDFLAILLTDEPALSKDSRLYQRLLAEDLEECSRLCEEELEALAPLNIESLAAYYDNLLLPALCREERDRHRGTLDDAKSNFIVSALRDWIDEARSRVAAPTPAVEEFSRRLQAAAAEPDQCPHAKIALLPVNDAADEAACTALKHVLELGHLECRTVTADIPASDAALSLQTWKPDVIFLSAVPPFSPLRFRQICRALKPPLKEARIVECIWDQTADLRQIAERLKTSGYDELVTTVAAAKSLLALSPERPEKQARSA